MFPLLVAINQVILHSAIYSISNIQSFGSYEERGREQEACPLLSSWLHSEASVEAHTPVTPGTVSSHLALPVTKPRPMTWITHLLSPAVTGPATGHDSDSRHFNTISTPLHWTHSFSLPASGFTLAIIVLMRDCSCSRKTSINDCLPRSPVPRSAVTLAIRTEEELAGFLAWRGFATTGEMFSP